MAKAALILSNKYRILATILVSTFFMSSVLYAEGVNPAARVKAAIAYWRDTSSYTESKMTIHRPGWQRTMAMKGWTKGLKLSLVRFTGPAKDAGNASLKTDKQMWNFSPKINRVIKIPASMMTQSWMGSDFSYNDLAKADDIIENYSHSLVGEGSEEGKKYYLIKAIPDEDAPVVWGKELLKIREDDILLEHTFFDQDLKPIKQLKTLKLKELGGKLYPVIMRMTNLEKPESWTEIETTEGSFGNSISDRLFTLASLRSQS